MVETTQTPHTLTSGQDTKDGDHGLTIRQATLEQLPQLSSLVFYYHGMETNQEWKPTLCEEKVIWYLHQNLIRGNPIFVAFSGERMVGLYGIEPSAPVWWSEDSGDWADYVWFVLPKFRKGGVGIKLLDAASEWLSKEHKGAYLISTMLNGDHLEAKDALFKKAKFDRIGSVYIKKG